jgi:hypothetical protein
MFKNLFCKRKLLIPISLVVIFLVFNAFARNNSEFFEPYATLLTNHVSYSTIDGIDTTVVDYAMWKFDIDYPKAMKLLKNTNPEKLEGNEKMAFWINAYNLLVIDLIISKNETKSIKDIGGLFKNPWTSYKWEIGGKKYNLETIEHKILRKMDDPRIHMALVCASLSCPNLMSRPYNSKELNSQLRWQTITFLANQRKGLQILSDNRIRISEIFKWFEKDFGGRIGLMEFLMEHNYRINENTQIDGYIKYNWKLNKF